MSCPKCPGKRVIAAVAASVLTMFPFCRTRGDSPAASITESRETIRTYPYSDPDPVPIFARSGMWGRGQRLYPYFFYDGFSGRASDREWTVVRLENPFLEVAVLPEVGGKVWGAADKASGRELLYTNHVMKFREIGLRGPWTSGGIEFNFGVVGHAPSTAAPVDYLLRRSPDGSAEVVVGTTDLPSRTRWSVTIRLPGDKAYFETDGFWHNPTAFSQSYYYWSCAAIKAADDLQYIFPGRFRIGHDYSVPLEPWPIDPSGRDLSWYANNDSPGSKSYFVVGDYADFYGAWYRDADAGFGHWALYDDMPGRKIWIWDLSRQGAIWADLLTDSDGQYSEPQAGRLLNQSDHGLLRPAISDSWRELWFPYRGIGPMRSASRFGVLSLEEDATGLHLGFFPVRHVDADLTVSSDGSVLLEDHLELGPEKAYQRDIPGTGQVGAYEVRLGDEIIYSSDPASGRLDRPLRFKAVDESTAEGLFLAGLRLEQERNYQQALEKYLACLDREPIHMRALARTAELYARRGEYAAGLPYAARALENAMYDPEANYVYGLIARRSGRLNDAKETLGWAARSLEFRSAAYVQLAEIAVLEKRPAPAADYAEKALQYNRFNSSAFEVLGVACRKLGQPDRARRALDELEAFDPLDHLGRFERYLLDPSEARLSAFRSMIRSEMPHESYLEMALFYFRMGCLQEALAMLENAPEQPTVCAWRAFLLRQSDPEESRFWLDKALSGSPRLVFPFREESIPVFEWAMAERPEDWKPKYYLGLIYWGKGRVDEALELFARAADADFAPFFLARGALYREKASGKALADFNRALELDGKSWRVWHGLVGFLLGSGKTAEALERARQAAGRFPDDVPIQVDLVKSLMAEGLYDEAAGVLARIQSLPFEGASAVHGLYVETHLAIAVDRMRKSDWASAVEHLEASKLYPESLGTGAPFNPDVRLQDYLEAICEERRGNPDRAEELRQSVLDFTLAHWDERGPGAYCGGLVLRRAGQERKALELLGAVPEPAILGKLGTR
jgi:tetratricopeptide (TPR) repeat protein